MGLVFAWISGFAAGVLAWRYRIAIRDRRICAELQAITDDMRAMVEQAKVKDEK